MDYALLAATALGAIGLYLMLPRERASLVKLGGLVGAMALAGLFLFLARLAQQGVDGGIGNGAPPIYFYLFAAIMIASAVGVICQPRPVYAALYFVLVTLAGAGMFVLLMAEFMAIVLIIIYAGAILVTYVFVIMLASQASTGGNVAAPLYDRRAAGSLVAIVVAFVLVGTTLQVLTPRRIVVVAAKWGHETTWKDVSKTLNDKVVAGRLNLVANVQTLGDPIPYKPKQLQITYKMEGLSETTRNFDEGARITLDHLLSRIQPSDPKNIPAALMAKSQENDATVSSVQVVGSSLYSQYGISLELAGILLTIALIGAVVIARKNTQEQQTLGSGKLPTQ